MSKYGFAILLAAGLFTMNGVFADEVTKSSSTKVEGADYSSSSNSTTTQEDPNAVTRKTTTTSKSSPYGQEITTKKTYKVAPSPRTKTTTTNQETTVNP